MILAQRQPGKWSSNLNLTWPRQFYPWIVHIYFLFLNNRGPILDRGLILDRGPILDRGSILEQPHVTWTLKKEIYKGKFPLRSTFPFNH